MKIFLSNLLIKPLILLLSGILIVACASSTQTKSENQSPGFERKVENTSNLEITIPAGWRKIQDNKEKLFELWLVNSDKNASISFIPIHIDSSLNGMSLAEKLNFAVDMTLKERQAGNEGFELIAKSEMTDMQGFRLLYKIGNQQQSSIIFGNENRLYECLAYFSEYVNFSEEEINNLFETQEYIVSNSEIK